MESVAREDARREHRLHIASKPFRRMVLSSSNLGLHEETVPLFASRSLHLPPSPKKKLAVPRQCSLMQAKTPSIHQSHQHSRRKKINKLHNLTFFIQRVSNNPEMSVSSKSGTVALLIIVAVQGVKGGGVVVEVSQ